MFRMTTDPEDAPDAPQEVVVGLEAGNPVSVDGETMGPVELLSHLNELAGSHGVGRIDIVENRFVGIKSRGVYETPGGTVLHAARRAVESIVLDREVLHMRDALAQQYARIVYNGFWYSPERRTLQATMDQIQSGVTGEARLVLYKGSARVLGRRSPNSIYDADVATFEADDVYDQADAKGFINLNALRIRGYGDDS
jgi:argininosuccinate synthase